VPVELKDHKSDRRKKAEGCSRLKAAPVEKREELLKETGRVLGERQNYAGEETPRQKGGKSWGENFCCLQRQRPVPGSNTYPKKRKVLGRKE